MANSKRKLAAIVFTDIVGFTKLSSKNEPAALALLESQRNLLKPIVDQYNGEWLKEIGDGLLLSFSTSRDAVDCAIAIQKASSGQKNLNLRIGIHQGEVVFQGGDVVGDDVNIASRIEPFAAEGGIAISGRVNSSLERDPDFETMFIGTPKLKGVAQKIEVFCITSHNLPKTDISTVSAKLEKSKGLKWNIFSVTGAALTVVGILFWINISFIGVGTASESSIPSIAVLPFENKGSTEDDFYAYGISSDLISDVTSTGVIRVAGLNDIEKLDYASMSYDDIADKLLVRYVAKGTLWKMDTMFQLSMELFDTKNDKVVWSNRWQTAWRDLATIKDDLSINILENLNVIITKNIEQVNMASNPEAYEYYLKGEYKFEKRTNLEELMIARGLYQKAVDLDSTLISALIKLAKTYSFTNEYEKTINLYNKSLKRAINQNNKTAEAYAYNGLGTAVMQKDGDLDKAQKYYEKGFNIAKENGDKVLLSFFLNNLAIIQNRKGNYDEALKLLQEMLESMVELGDKKGEWFALNNIAVIYNSKGDLDNWFYHSKQALALAIEMEDLPGKARTLISIATYYSVKEKYNESIQEYNKILQIYKNLGQKEDQISIYAALGQVYLYNNNDQKSFEMYKKALDLSIEIDHKPSIVQSYISINEYYKNKEEFSKALNSLYLAKSEINKINSSYYLVYNLYYTGLAHYSRGDLDSARIYFDRSIKLNQDELGNTEMVLELYTQKSITHVVKGELDIGLDLMKKASSLAKEKNNMKEYQGSQFSIGIIYFLKKEYKLAADEYLSPAISALQETHADTSLYKTSIYFNCLKELNRDYDIAELKTLIEKEKGGKIDEETNYYIFKLLGEQSYLKEAFEKVSRIKSKLEPEIAKKYSNYPHVKKIIKDWEMNI